MAYRLDFDIDSYLSLYISIDDMEEVMDDLYYPEGEPLSSVWSMPVGELIDARNKGRQLTKPDICGWEGNLVLSPKAMSALESYVCDFAEFLPVNVEGETWYIVNITTVSDAVDSENSEKDLIGGIFIGLKKLAFDDSLLSDINLFKTSFDEMVGNFCNLRFKELVEKEFQLLGVMFRSDLERP